MLKTFEELAKNVKLKPKLMSIDNIVFKLHYRFTFLCLLVATILVSSQQYIGEHIRCIADAGISINVIETYCFFTSTFTVVRHLAPSAVSEVPHPGVGPMVPDEPVRHHAYYQWVPFVLFGQGLMFYLPHLLWRNLEGGRIKALVTGLEHASLASGDKDVTINDKVTVPSKSGRETMLVGIQKAFIDRLHINRPWASWLIFCEILNAGNVALQFYLTNLFLGGSFLNLGPAVVEAGLDSDVHPLDVAFPKITKCIFHKYGPSGSIQTHDAMCVMALNIINEKVYTFFWFWLVILSIATVLGLLWRLLTFVLHSRSNAFNKFIFGCTSPGTVDAYDLIVITGKCQYPDWLFLYYLGKNMDGRLFRDLFEMLASEIDRLNWSEKVERASKEQVDENWKSKDELANEEQDGPQYQTMPLRRGHVD